MLIKQLTKIFLFIIIIMKVKRRINNKTKNVKNFAV